MNKKQLYDEAVTAYVKHCKQNDFIYQQPSQALCTIGWKYVHLRNVNGRVAKYNHRKKVIVWG